MAKTITTPGQTRIPSTALVEYQNPIMFKIGGSVTQCVASDFPSQGGPNDPAGNIIYIVNGESDSPVLSGSSAIVTNSPNAIIYCLVPTPSSHFTTAVKEDTDWAKLFAKLDSFLALKKAWDSYKALPPNEMARNRTRSFLESLSVENYSPSQVAPSVIGGIGVNRRRGSKKVYIEFNNNGKVHALFSDGTSPPRVEQVQPDKIGFQVLIRRMRAYLDEHNP